MSITHPNHSLYLNMFLKTRRINLGQENLKLFKRRDHSLGRKCFQGVSPSLLIVLILSVLCNQILLQLVWHHDFLHYQHRADGAFHPAAVLNKSKLNTTVSIFS